MRDDVRAASPADPPAPAGADGPSAGGASGASGAPGAASAPGADGPLPWTRIEAQFEALVDASPAESAARLATVARDDPALAAELRALLAARDAARDWLDPAALATLAASLLGTLDEDGPGDGPNRTGQILGAWRLQERLGRGGMGEVWSATRADGAFAMDVAVKLVRRGLDTSDAARRFRVERQVLADLVHPGIARLIDGGTTDDGRPYLVMERVDGEPIDRFCAERALSVPARLELFVQLCDAVSAAHALGIVHRDLKPGNVLVTRSGAVKLLDFGIAKLLVDDRPHEPVETLTGQRLLTPRYASPEQVRGGAITPASDVFTLGVLLYELLTGVTPHGPGTGTPRELEASVCERAPVPPSAAVEPRARTALRGDLDTITLRALAKEPDARYLSASAMADDVRRHLAGVPILARRDTAWQRARRFMRLHRALTISTVTTVLVLGAGLVAALVLHDRSERFRGEAEYAAYASGIAAAEADIRSGRVSDARRRLEALPESLRGWEWTHLVHRLDGSVARIPLASVASMPIPLGDGRIAMLALPMESALLSVVSPAGVQQEIALDLERESGRMAYDAPRARITVGTPDGALVSASLADGSTRRLRPVSAGPRNMPAVEHLPDGVIVYAFGTRIELVDPVDGSVIRAWEAHAESIMSTRVLPDGRIVSGGSDHALRFWDREGRLLMERTEHTQRVTEIEVDASRGEFLTVALDVLLVRRIEDGAVVLRLDAGTPVCAAVFAGDEILTAGDDNMVRRWDRGTGQLIARLVGHETSVMGGCSTGLVHAPLATVDGGTLLFWPRDGGDPPGLLASIFVAALDLDPTGLLVADAPNGHLQAWRLPERALAWEQRTPDIFTGVAIDAARARLAVGVNDGSVSVRALDDGRELARLPPHPHDSQGEGMLVHVLPDGRIAAARRAGILRLFHLDGRVDVLGQTATHGMSVLRVPCDAPWLAINNITPVLGLPEDFPSALPDVVLGASAAALHPDGRRLAVAIDTARLVLLDLGTGRELAGVDLRDRIHALDFHPDGTRLAAATYGGTVRLFDVEAWREVAALHGHSARVHGVRFSPDGRTLVSSSYEGRLLVWSTDP